MPSENRLVSVFCFVAMILVAPVLGQGPVPIGSDFQVDDHTPTTGLDEPSIAISTDGDFIVVWDSNGSPGDDMDGDSIQAKRFLSDGVVVFDQFQVNTHPPNYSELADVAPLPDGGFVVVWEARASPGNDDSSDSVQARLFDRDGNGLGPQFQVNT